jgi:fumarylpyruvate hydrolase
MARRTNLIGEYIVLNCLKPQPQTMISVVGADEKFYVRRVYCVGRNYAEHAREMGFDPDREPPFFFCKPTDSVVYVADGMTGEIPYPSLTSNYHYEAELVVAIGKGGKDITVDEAKNHIFGYAVGLDMTRRDLQMKMREQGRPWEIGKAFDQSAPVGPIHRLSDIGEVTSGEIKLNVNGKVKQNSDLKKLIWSVDEIISVLSTYFVLQPGDLIFTGTPEGVGAVNQKDVMTCFIEKLGTLKVAIL